MNGNFCQLFFICLIIVITHAISFSQQKSGKCEPPEIVADLRPACSGMQNGAIDLKINGGMPPYKITWSNGSTRSQLKDLGVGEYQVRVTDVIGCVRERTLIITEAPVLSAITQVEHNKRSGRSKAAIKVEVQGGTAPYRFSWVSNRLELQTAPTPGDNTRAGLPAGWYKIVVFDAANCFYEIETQVR